MNDKPNPEADVNGWKIAREWAAILFGLGGMILGIAGYHQNSLATQKAEEVERIARYIVVEDLLSEGWDHLGGMVGTTVIYSFTDDYRELEEARRKIQEALDRDPNSAKAYRYLAVYFEATKQPNRAFSNYERALQLDSNDVRTFLNYGFALATNSQSGQALVQFERALQLMPNEVPEIARTTIILTGQQRQAAIKRTLAKINEILAMLPEGLTHEDKVRIQKLLNDQMDIFDIRVAREDPKKSEPIS
jgi:tetratricopeptide (TPR) repeat protein